MSPKKSGQVLCKGAGGGTESFNTVIRNATDPESTVYDTNRVGGSFQYGFTRTQGWSCFRPALLQWACVMIFLNLTYKFKDAVCLVHQIATFASLVWHIVSRRSRIAPR